MRKKYRRDLISMHQSPRCAAKNRNGSSCKSPAVTGKPRCRMHGGAFGSGAPRGNKNAIKNGYYTTDAKAYRKHLNAAMLQMRRDLDDFQRPAK